MINENNNAYINNKKRALAGEKILNKQNDSNLLNVTRANNDYYESLFESGRLMHAGYGSSTYAPENPHKQHKYVRIENGRYIYPEDLQKQRQANNGQNRTPNPNTKYIKKKEGSDSAAITAQKNAQKMNNVKQRMERQNKQNQQTQQQNSNPAGINNVTNAVLNTAKQAKDAQNKQAADNAINNNVINPIAAVAKQAVNSAEKKAEELNVNYDTLGQGSSPNNKQYKDFDDIIREVLGSTDDLQIGDLISIANERGVKVEDLYNDIEEAAKAEAEKQAKAESAYKAYQSAERKVNMIFEAVKDMDKIDKQILADMIGIDEFEDEALDRYYFPDGVPENTEEDYGAAYHQTIADGFDKLWNDFKAARTTMGHSVENGEIVGDGEDDDETEDTPELEHDGMNNDESLEHSGVEEQLTPEQEYIEFRAKVEASEKYFSNMRNTIRLKLN